MNLLSFFKRSSSAPIARERLQILLAHERAVLGRSDLLAILQEEILAVVARHFPVESESIKVKMERGEGVSTLEVEVEIPTPLGPNISLNAQKQQRTENAPKREPEELPPPSPASPEEASAAADI